MSQFLLCDPALLMPPPPDEEGAADFWSRLVEWSSDRRLRLGPAGHQMIVSLLGEFGWPQYDSARYPPGLARLAYRALATLLSQVATATPKVGGPSPALVPKYQAHEMGEAAIGTDAAALHETGLLGLASAEEHWVEPSESVFFEPPPPVSLQLLFEPGGALGGESDAAVRRFLRQRRLTIVGGIADDRILSELQDRFCPKELRWFGAEPGSRLNLDGLLGLQARADVVYCITGHIGHDGSIKAKQCCKKRGVEMRKVANANDIAEDLCRRHSACKLT